MRQRAPRTEHTGRGSVNVPTLLLGQHTGRLPGRLSPLCAVAVSRCNKRSLSRVDCPRPAAVSTSSAARVGPRPVLTDPRPFSPPVPLRPDLPRPTHAPSGRSLGARAGCAPALLDTGMPPPFFRRRYPLPPLPRRTPDPCRPLAAIPPPPFSQSLTLSLPGRPPSHRGTSAAQ